MPSTHSPLIDVPADLVASHQKFFGEPGRPWIEALPHLAARLLDHWQLRLDGRPTCGAVALVVPVLRADDTPAALKLQPVDHETRGEPIALRTWDGRGAVRLLEHDPDSGSMLLERLDVRSLQTMEDDMAALSIIAELLTRLNAVPAPPGVSRLADVMQGLLDEVPHVLPLASGPQRRLIEDCAGAVRELLPESGDQLLHLDLHFYNTLASLPSQQREPWLAIDPKPLVGDPGFELLPALHNRWDDVVATGDIARAVRRRFDLMTDTLGLDRRRARGWTLGRILQSVLWDAKNSDTTVHSPADAAIAHILLARG
ncbi:aminoglycoside phosphotransferase family protein [Actinopolymorpha pittospori]